jgi:hypothetical protein
MPIPNPEPGLVISYAYLWHDHGFLPPRFFNHVLDAFAACYEAGKRRLTPRE